MGTRGLMGFVVDGEVKGTYNHYDSYPSGLGVQVGAFAATLTGERLAEYANKARAVRLVQEEDKPTQAEIDRFAATTEEVGNNPGQEWYSILRGLQGKPGETLDAGVMIDQLSFAHDSLFCEWGYVVNFDTGMLEVYRGFQNDPAKVKGRFANGEQNRGYASITLLGQLPFTFGDSQTFWDTLEAAVYSEDEAEDPQAAIESAFQIEAGA